MKKVYNILNIALILAILVGDVFYIVYGGLLIKSITSACFFVLGLINLIYAIRMKTPRLKFAIYMVIGLFFAMMGDIILEIHFITGAALFAIGHVFYFIAYCHVISFKWKDLIYGACIFVPATLFITLAPIFDFGGILMELVCIIYAIIISIMVGKSISNYVASKNILNLIIMIGSILFMFSDIMLLLNVFADLPRIVGILCLATYYPAECLLAYTIMKSDN